MCAPTRTAGRSVKYCTKPIRPWPSSTATSTSAARAGPLRADGAEREDSATDEAEQQEDHVGVHLGDRLRVQAVAGGAVVAGVRAAAGDPGADDQHGDG